MVKVGDFEVKEGYYYHEEHFWAKVEEGVVKFGITDYGQDGLKEVIVVELPSVGEKVTQNKTFGVVESEKAVVDLIAPISGQVKEVNQETLDNPKNVNKDPYGTGWLVAVAPSNLDEELQNIMDFKAALDYHKDFADLTTKEEGMMHF